MLEAFVPWPLEYFKVLLFEGELHSKLVSALGLIFYCVAP